MSGQCSEKVYVRDQYRRTGRGRSGFEMHYRRQQCSRVATKDGLCWQHQPGYLAEMLTKRWQRKLGRIAASREQE